MDIMILQEYMALESNKPKRVQIKIGRIEKCIAIILCLAKKYKKENFYEGEEG